MTQIHPLDSLSAMRARLLKGMLTALSILGLPALVIACFEAARLNQTGGILLYIVLYFLAVSATLAFNRIPFVFSACVMLGCLYMISLFTLMHFSFSGAGIEIFLTVTVLTTVLLGIHSGLFVGGLCLVSLIASGLCFVYGLIPITPGMPATTGQLVSWLTAAGVFILLAGTTILGAGMLQEHLIRSAATVHSQAEALARANEKLSEEMQQRSTVEGKLKQSELQFRTLFEMAPDAMYLTDLEGSFIDGNQAAETLMGISRNTFIGKNFLTLGILSPDEAPKALDLLEKNIQGQSTGPDEISLVNTDGKTIVVEIRTAPFHMNDRPVILGIARDVSERKRLEARINQARKMESVGNLAGGVAHDFNNMLSVIIGNAELAMNQTDPDDFSHHCLQEVLTAARHSATVTSQLLAFARKQTAAPAVLDLNQTIETMLRLHRRLIGETIDLAYKPGKDVWPVKMDPSQIDQILANLCANAGDAVSDNGKIIIETSTITIDPAFCTTHADAVPGDFVLLAVSDNGCGMDKQTLDNLFEPFYTTKGVGEGSGLGLATVYGIVRQNNGFITVESTPGSGTTFNLFLPRYLSKAELSFTIGVRS
ncbi:MAG TPA: ATP-binding protein [Desulfotignum sp.]|nr:ATP-binding protein [Desulfotignum sp.]